MVFDCTGDLLLVPDLAWVLMGGCPLLRGIGVP
jgi:hypothetical protein